MKLRKGFEGGVSLATPDEELEAFYQKYPWSREALPEYSHNALYTTPSAHENLLNTFIPTNVQAAYGTYIGADTPFTQHHFLPEDLEAMARNYQAGQRAYVGGYTTRPQTFSLDWGNVPHDRFVSYPEYTQATHAMSSMQSVPNPLEIGQSYFNQGMRIGPFEQGAYYSEEPEGIYLRNDYVGPGGAQREVNVLLPNRSQK